VELRVGFVAYVVFLINSLDIMSNSIQPEDLVGREIRGYQVEKPIGAGKFSVVFRAQQI